MEPFFGQNEPVHMDRRRLALLCTGLGAQGARQAVFRAMDELTNRLNATQSVLAGGDLTTTAKAARGMIGIADELGLVSFAQIASDVARCAARRDPVATGATMARLLRVGDGSMAQIWDLRDLSI